MRFGISRLMLCSLLALATAATADAGPVRGLVQRLTHRGGCQSAPVVASAPCGQTPSTAFTGGDGEAVGGGVQWKADVQARQGRCFHPGGGFVPGASYEGVGFSSLSPEDALNHCCNNGGPVVAQAVARGPGGWYAVKQYGTPGVARQAVGAVVSHAGLAVGEVGGLIRHGTSYHPPAVVGGAVYQPIRLGVPLPAGPTCVGGNCGR